MQIAKDLEGLDRRIEPRHSVSIEGVLIDMKNTARRIDCMITDLSESGARIARQCETMLPDQVMLFEAHNGNIFESEVRWRRDKEAGLRFWILAAGRSAGP